MCCWLHPYVPRRSCLCTERPHGRLAVQFTVLLHKNSLCYETIPVHPNREGLGFVQSWFNKQDARAGKGFALASACTWAAEWHESMSSCCDLVLCVLTQSRIKDFFSKGSRHSSKTPRLWSVKSLVEVQVFME